MIDDPDSVPLIETFAALLEREHVPADRVDAIVAQVAEQVAALHASGGVHGAVHPETVLVAPDGSARLLEPEVARGVRGIGWSPDGDEAAAPTQSDDLDALEDLRDASPALDALPAGSAEADRPRRRIGTGAAVLVVTAGVGLSVALVGTAAAGLADFITAPSSTPRATSTALALPAPDLTLAPGALGDPSYSDDGGSGSDGASGSRSDPVSAGTVERASQQQGSSSGGSTPVDAGRATPTPTPTPTSSPTPTSTPTSSPSPARSASPTPTPTAPTPVASATAEPTPTSSVPVPISTPTPTATATPTPVPTAEPTASPVPTASPTPTAEPTATPTPTADPTPTATPAPTAEPTATPQPTTTPSSEPTATPSAEPSATPSATASPSAAARREDG